MTRWRPLGATRPISSNKNPSVKYITEGFMNYIFKKLLYHNFLDGTVAATIDDKHIHTRW